MKLLNVIATVFGSLPLTTPAQSDKREFDHVKQVAANDMVTSCPLRAIE